MRVAARRFPNLAEHVRVEQLPSVAARNAVDDDLEAALLRRADGVATVRAAGIFRERRILDLLEQRRKGRDDMSISQVVGNHAIAFVHAREERMLRDGFKGLACLGMPPADRLRLSPAHHYAITGNRKSSPTAQRGVQQLHLRISARTTSATCICARVRRGRARYSHARVLHYVVLISARGDLPPERFAEVDAIRRLLAEKQSQCDVLVRAMNRRLACVGFVRSSTWYFRKYGGHPRPALRWIERLLLLVAPGDGGAPLGFALADQATEIKEEPAAALYNGRGSAAPFY